MRPFSTTGVEFMLSPIFNSQRRSPSLADSIYIHPDLSPNTTRPSTTGDVPQIGARTRCCQTISPFSVVRQYKNPLLEPMYILSSLILGLAQQPLRSLKLRLNPPSALNFHLNAPVV